MDVFSTVKVHCGTHNVTIYGFQIMIKNVHKCIVSFLAVVFSVI